MWQAEYAQCKKFANERGWLIDDYYICQGDLVVGISKERPFRLKPCFSYPHPDGSSLDKLLSWVEKRLNG